MQLANTDAQARRGPTPAADQQPPVVYVEPDAPTPIVNPIRTPEVRPGRHNPNELDAPQGVETRAAFRSVAFYSRLSEGHHLRGGDVANGLHAVVARQASGLPRGEQTPWPVAERSTLFRPPSPWDRGSVRATPGSTPGTATVAPGFLAPGG